MWVKCDFFFKTAETCKTSCLSYYMYSYLSKSVERVRQLLVEVLYILEADACRSLALTRNPSHNSTPVNFVRQQLPRRRMAPCQAASIREAPGHWCLGLPVMNGQILNSMAVLKARLFLYCTKTLQCKLLLCYWHGVEGCCHSLGLHLSSKHWVADVMPANHLLTLQMEVFWAYVWKMHQIWYHSHQGNFSLASPVEVHFPA